MSLMRSSVLFIRPVVMNSSSSRILTTSSSWRRSMFHSLPSMSQTISPKSTLVFRSFSTHPESSSSSSSSTTTTTPADSTATDNMEPAEAEDNFYRSAVQVLPGTLPTEEDESLSQYGALIYASPYETIVKRVKKLSISSAVIAVAAAPVMVYLSQHSSSAGKIALAGTVVLFGTATTALLSFFTKSYVTRVYAKRNTNSLTPVTPTVDEKGLPNFNLSEWDLSFERLKWNSVRYYNTAPISRIHPLLSQSGRQTVRIFLDRDSSDITDQQKHQDVFIHVEEPLHPLLGKGVFHQQDPVMWKTGAVLDAASREQLLQNLENFKEMKRSHDEVIANAREKQQQIDQLKGIEKEDELAKSFEEMKQRLAEKENQNKEQK